MKEADLHKSVVKYLDTALPRGALYFHIPNGGWRHKRTAAELKRMGALAGVPDLQIIHAGRCFFIELKAPKGRVTDSQRAVLDKLRCNHINAAICRSIEDVRDALQEWKVPLRKVTV